MTTSTTPQNAPYLVLGGTGKTGRRVADGLTRRGFTARAASRKGPVRFDWSDEESWAPALAGVRAVYVVDSQGPDATAELRAFGKAATAAGVERLVLLSARTWAELDDGSGELLAAEKAVRESGLEWTILRPAWFAQNFLEENWFPTLFTEGELRLPVGAGREPFIDLDDLADVAVAALTEDGHAGETYVLSGPRAMTWGEAVQEISRAAGRPLRYVPLTDAEYTAEMTGRHGFPADFVELLLPMFRHIRNDGSAELSDGVRRALGREPRDFAEYAARTTFPAEGA